MVYAKHLREAGSQFMKTQLNYYPGNGNGRQTPRNGGGEFMSVHLRRRDYTYAHAGVCVCVCVCVHMWVVGYKTMCVCVIWRSAHNIVHV